MATVIRLATCLLGVLYADDAVLLAPTIDVLQNLIDVRQEFARNVHLATLLCHKFQTLDFVHTVFIV